MFPRIRVVVLLLEQLNCSVVIIVVCVQVFVALYIVAKVGSWCTLLGALYFCESHSQLQSVLMSRGIMVIMSWLAGAKCVLSGIAVDT